MKRQRILAIGAMILAIPLNLFSQQKQESPSKEPATKLEAFLRARFPGRMILSAVGPYNQVYMRSPEDGSMTPPWWPTR